MSVLLLLPASEKSQWFLVATQRQSTAVHSLYLFLSTFLVFLNLVLCYYEVNDENITLGVPL